MSSTSVTDTSVTDPNNTISVTIPDRDTKMEEKTDNNRINIFVFDMDETLGFFTEIFVFCNSLENYFIHYESYLFANTYLTIQEETNTYTVSDKHFFDILQTFFMCIRPHIFTILLRVFLHKKSPQDKIVLYTNNQCKKTWCEKIIRFFEYHFRENYNLDICKSDNNNNTRRSLFDNVIGAYMVNGVQIEKNRTRHEKCTSDLINCLGLPTNASGDINNNIRILFMDDVTHEQMIHPNITYILCKPYVYYYDYNYMIETYYNKFMRDVHNVYFPSTNNIYEQTFKNHMMYHLSLSGMNMIKKTTEEYCEDNLDSLKLLDYVKEFYLENNPAILQPS